MLFAVVIVVLFWCISPIWFWTHKNVKERAKKPNSTEATKQKSIHKQCAEHWWIVHGAVMWWYHEKKYEWLYQTNRNESKRKKSTSTHTCTQKKKHPSPVETVFSSIIHDGFLAFIPYAYFTTHICVEQLEQMKRKKRHSSREASVAAAAVTAA